MAGQMLFAQDEQLNNDVDFAQFTQELDDALTTVCVFSETDDCPPDVRMAVHQLAKLITVKTKSYNHK